MGGTRVQRVLAVTCAADGPFTEIALANKQTKIIADAGAIIDDCFIYTLLPLS
jgi:hypothetical protein